MDSSGLRHTLTIRDTTLDDKAEYAVEVDDLQYKTKYSACKLSVTKFGT